MPRRLTVHVLRAVALPSLLASVSVIGLAALGAAGQLAAHPLTEALPGDRVGALLVALWMPLLPAALPLALFAGLVAGVARMEADGEVEAARALGAGPWQLAAPTLALGLLVAGLTAGAAAWGEPWGRHTARTALADLQGPDLRPRQGPLVLQVDGALLGAAALDAGGELRDVVLWRDDGAELVRAPHGSVTLRDGALTVSLRDGEAHHRLPDGTYVRWRFGGYQATVPVRWGRRTGREPFELAPRALLRTIDERRTRGEEVRFHQLALHRRIAVPLAVPLLTLLAWPLARPRRWGGGTARGVLLAVVVGVGYYLLLRVGDHGLRSHHWPPILAAYGATVVLALIAGVAWWRRWRR